eukprot:1801704-Rhodomonas_salina.1
MARTKGLAFSISQVGVEKALTSAGLTGRSGLSAEVGVNTCAMPLRATRLSVLSWKGHCFAGPWLGLTRGRVARATAPKTAVPSSPVTGEPSGELSSSFSARSCSDSGLTGF